MKPICNALIARSIAPIAGANRWIEKVLGFQSHNHFLSRLLFQIENIVRSTIRISKDFLAEPIGIVICSRYYISTFINTTVARRLFD